MYSTYITFYINPEEPLVTQPAQPELIHPSVRLSVCLSVRLSVHACCLGIERKMAQAQQFWSIILENHEST